MVPVNKYTKGIFQPASAQSAYQILKTVVAVANNMLRDYLNEPSLQRILEIHTLLQKKINESRAHWPTYSAEANKLRGQAYHMLGLCRMVQDKNKLLSIEQYEVAKTHFDRAQELGWESHQTKELQEVLQSILTAYDQVAAVSIGNINKKHDLQKRKLERTHKREIERRIRESKRKKREKERKENGEEVPEVTGEIFSENRRRRLHLGMPIAESAIREKLKYQSCKLVREIHDKIQEEISKKIDEFLNVPHSEPVIKP